MHGDLVVESTPGKGSVFTFSFEAGAASSSAVPAPRRAPDSDGARPGSAGLEGADRRRRADQPRSARRTAVAHGLHRRARRRAARKPSRCHDEWHPDLVLMDLRMPGMGGLEAIRRLRERGSKAAIIAVTASSLAEAEERGARRRRGRVRAQAVPGRRAARDDRGAARRALRLRTAAAAAVGRAVRQARGRSTLSQRLRGLPPALIDQLREAAIEGRAKRLESLADQVGQHSEAVSAEIRALARDFQYDALVSALRRARATKREAPAMHGGTSP